MAIKQSLQQRLLQKLSPQQIQLMKMLQLPTLELEKRIKEELELNPALDEGEEQNQELTDENNVDTSIGKREDFNYQDYVNDETPYYKTQSNNSYKDQDDNQTPLSLGDSFTEKLVSQISLRIKDEKHLVIAEQIIGNLDESGYLRRELFNIVDDLAFSQNILTTEKDLEQVLLEVQELDPPGVGARDLQECLLIQLRKKKKTISTKTAEVILEKCFESFKKKHYKKKKFWFYAPIDLLSFAALSRTIAFFFHGAALSVDKIAIELVIAGFLLFLVKRDENTIY